jgi:hypothetical protein
MVLRTLHDRGRYSRPCESNPLSTSERCFDRLADAYYRGFDYRDSRQGECGCDTGRWPFHILAGENFKFVTLECSVNFVTHQGAHHKSDFAVRCAVLHSQA